MDNVNEMSGYRYADVGERVIAFLIDGATAYALLFGASICRIAFFGRDSFSPYIIMLIPVIYWMCRDIVNGKGVGKRLAKTCIRSKDNVQQVPDMWRLIVRNLFNGIWPIEFIIILASKDNRRLADVVCGTVVVKEKRIYKCKSKVIEEYDDL